jgi:hypothetical protein
MMHRRPRPREFPARTDALHAAIHVIRPGRMHGSLRTLVAVALLVGTRIPLAAQSTPVPAADRPRVFDTADREAQSVTWVMECAQMGARARNRGVFGPVDSLGPFGLCVRIGPTRHGVFMDADSALTRASNVRLVNFATMARSTAPLDTAALLGELRAKRAAMRLGAPGYAAERRQFVPLSYRDEDDGRVHVWLIPGALLDGEALGGERWWVFAPDGATVLESHDAGAQWRPFTLPTTRDVTITSTEADIPLLSEFMLANLLARGGRVPSIVTGTHTSTLTGDTWVHVRRTR